MKAIFTVLFSPTQTFERIRGEGKHFALPFIFVLLLSALTFVLGIPLIEYQAELMAPVDGTGAGFDEGAAVTVMTVTGIVGTLIGVAFSIFFGGLLLLLINLIVRGEAKYMQLVKVALFAGIPNLLQGLLFGIMTRFMEPAAALKLNFSLAAFFDSSSGFLFGLASMINPFTLWALALMVIGTAVMGRKPTKQVAVWLVAGWLLLQLVGIWFSTLFSGLTGM